MLFTITLIAFMQKYRISHPRAFNAKFNAFNAEFFRKYGRGLIYTLGPQLKKWGDYAPLNFYPTPWYGVMR